MPTVSWLRRRSRPEKSISVPPTTGPTSPFVVLPKTQAIQLLRAVKQPYHLVDSFPLPEIQHGDEFIIRVEAIGLNPIDWKAPDFNLGIPELPYLSGREFSGVVAQGSLPGSRFQGGDRFIPIATDYRDQRKAAFQEYAIGKTCNIVRLPRRLSFEQGSTIGVAFVAAALALGVRMGPDFLPFFDGPDLYQVLRDISPEDLPADVLQECLEAIQGHERIRPGDWIAIWGGSSGSKTYGSAFSWWNKPAACP